MRKKKWLFMFSLFIWKHVLSAYFDFNFKPVVEIKINHRSFQLILSLLKILYYRFISVTPKKQRSIFYRIVSRMCIASIFTTNRAARVLSDCVRRFAYSTKEDKESDDIPQYTCCSYGNKLPKIYPRKTTLRKTG